MDEQKVKELKESMQRASRKLRATTEKLRQAEVDAKQVLANIDRAQGKKSAEIIELFP